MGSNVAIYYPIKSYLLGEFNWKVPNPLNRIYQTCLIESSNLTLQI